MWSLISRFRRRTDAADRASALTELERLRATKQRNDGHDPNPNRYYSTPFEGGQYPGVNPGGPF